MQIILVVEKYLIVDKAFLGYTLSKMLRPEQIIPVTPRENITLWATIFNYIFNIIYNIFFIFFNYIISVYLICAHHFIYIYI